MINDIINNLKGQLTGELQNKYDLQPDTANKSVDLAKDNIMDEMKQRAASGDIGGLMDVFKGNKAPGQSSAVDGMIGKYVSDLTGKLGIPASVAQQVAPFAINFIMQKITGKVSSGNVSQTDLLGGLMGGGLKDSLSKGLGGLFK